MKTKEQISPFLSFDREEWAELRQSYPMEITPGEIERLKGLNDVLNMQEVADIYLPLTRLINLHTVAAQELYRSRSTFLHTKEKKVPYIIGIAGSVAVGKSTIARVLHTLLSRWDKHPRVDLVTTDGFLYPNAELERRGLMNKKGFPESYDARKLLSFLSELKSGKAKAEAPVYSHLTYDIVPGERQVVESPDIVIIEGINVLQPPKVQPGDDSDQVSVSDYFDFSIYVDAQEDNILRWYVERFKALRETAFQDRQSYFHKYANLSDEEAEQTARDIWERINRKNLHENILPTRHRADLILLKGDHHFVSEIKMRKI
ncbi:type I pantothenate kinase [Salisediminibacterium selenitireducens]|uniref:Pantothenate kinase n=1 Tax=Bacillus selenitireducens (strain ATCC 700615 / DSM 15326 / MLS10) TaxID=439292 RepID=D6Y1E4_BACIE|nr:type I pantothenate kinase [Salisediminibacterium selenitireducens]ADI00731.1 pantothenate kinase [[Bacillus] selenitireducens MLS10]